MNTTDPIELAIRVDSANPNHHLWNNNGTWFIHYTVHEADFTASRIRSSLGTKSVTEARRRRDLFFRHLGFQRALDGESVAA